MKIFANTTLQKGLEAYLPTLATPEEVEHIYGIVGRILKSANPIPYNDKLYDKLDETLSFTNDDITDEDINMGKEVCNLLYRSTKEYHMPMFPTADYVRGKRRREIQTLNKILLEQKSIKNERR